MNKHISRPQPSQANAHYVFSKSEKFCFFFSDISFNTDCQMLRKLIILFIFDSHGERTTAWIWRKWEKVIFICSSTFIPCARQTWLKSRLNSTERSASLIGVAGPETIDKIHNMELADWRLQVHEIIGISHGSRIVILHDPLGKGKSFAKWVPRLLRVG